MITLTKVDATRHMARFYSVAVLPDLFGGCRLVREWGRLDQSGGQSASTHFETEAEALARGETIAEAKRRRGYVPSGGAAS